MAAFRKKPVVVEATQWFENGDHPLDESVMVVVPRGQMPFLSEGEVVRRYRHPNVGAENQCKHCGGVMHGHGWIDTLEGGHIVCPKDWIITGVAGEHYPCKPAIFEATYERVGEFE